MANYPSLDSSIHPSPSTPLHPSLSIRPSIHLNALVIANPNPIIIKDTQ